MLVPEHPLSVGGRRTQPDVYVIIESESAVSDTVDLQIYQPEADLRGSAKDIGLVPRTDSIPSLVGVRPERGDVMYGHRTEAICGSRFRESEDMDIMPKREGLLSKPDEGEL